MDAAQAEQAVFDLLCALGEDPFREGLLETPRRVARMWAEVLDADHGTLDSLFSSEEADQLVVVRGMRVHSFCEHHLLPFWCDVTVGYLAQGAVLGLSKFARVSRKCAGALQTQERLVQEIADEIVSLLGHDDVAVQAVGRHSCMEMRGVRTPGEMISSVLRGLLREDATLRAEFLALARG